jgi:hypothetical protein
MQHCPFKNDATWANRLLYCTASNRFWSLGGEPERRGGPIQQQDGEAGQGDLRPQGQGH